MLIDLRDGRQVNPDHVIYADLRGGVVEAVLVSLDPHTGLNERLHMRGDAAVAWIEATRGRRFAPPPPLTLRPPRHMDPEQMLAESWPAEAAGATG